MLLFAAQLPNRDTSGGSDRIAEFYLESAASLLAFWVACLKTVILRLDTTLTAREYPLIACAIVLRECESDHEPKSAPHSPCQLRTGC